MTHVVQDWRGESINYLLNIVLTEDKHRPRKLRNKAARYYIVTETLYRRTYTSPLAKCL